MRVFFGGCYLFACLGFGFTSAGAVIVGGAWSVIAIGYGLSALGMAWLVTRTAVPE